MIGGNFADDILFLEFRQNSNQKKQLALPNMFTTKIFWVSPFDDIDHLTLMLGGAVASCHQLQDQEGNASDCGAACAAARRCLRDDALLLVLPQFSMGICLWPRNVSLVGDAMCGFNSAPPRCRRRCLRRAVPP